ncbi:hypothetical protein N7499_012079 [Penicillium canescens]|uniref:Uncharacterized protein n=1 Tax=Penicillium canescens TaxID=5083 RepID=A0AAD6IGZ1_PENCN|nr:uncharacterized protein N7446_003444 [Penicillium canescens]KAJ5995938.1 hypothetical protein N7522_007598 [Penicillium canescens]KAJ6045242.1 hypothetical protein N7460_006597 [Penicillium canescens]KAJ6056711.1 hypothetical protein N7444_005809 [Penicillium canescens]KAJ6066005.1 hypothetical protein N7499_012079 [Penicillium canescens]KAJ6075667.1 hypothetical protein N7446_003444 [Penicillium canescens]
MTGFFHYWTDAMPKMDLFEFLRQKVMWNVGTSEVEFSTLILLEDCDLCLEQLKKSYLHPAASNNGGHDVGWNYTARAAIR